MTTIALQQQRAGCHIALLPADTEVYFIYEPSTLSKKFKSISEQLKSKTEPTKEVTVKPKFVAWRLCF